jgi:hypothetical protein
LRLVAAVEDGERAWDAIQRDRPRVAVLDVVVALLTIHRSELHRSTHTKCIGSPMRGRGGVAQTGGL